MMTIKTCINFTKKILPQPVKTAIHTVIWIVEEIAKVIACMIKDAAYFLGFRKHVELIILGGQKCGTSALAAYLNNHPSCSLLIGGKEPRYFSAYYPGEATIERYLIKKMPLKKMWQCKKMFFFDATAGYIYLEDVPERIYKYNPDIKLILLVRNPIDRAYSEYMMDYNYAQREYVFWEDPQGEYLSKLKDPAHYPFSWFIDEEIRKMENAGSISPSTFYYPDMLRKGLYSEQLERYYHYFKPEQILILEDQELKNRRQETLARVEACIGIPRHEWLEDTLINVFEGKYFSAMPEDCRDRLRTFFAPWNEKFFKLINRRFEWS